MLNNSFCKVAILIFCVITTCSMVGATFGLGKSAIGNLLEQKHSYEINALKAQKLHIGNSLMPKVQLSLGQTISSHEPDTQTWGSFSINSPIINLPTRPKLQIADLSIAEAKLKHDLEIYKLERSQLKDLVMLTYLQEQKKLLDKSLLVAQKLEKLRSKELELGISSECFQEELVSLKLTNDLNCVDIQIDFYKKYLPIGMQNHLFTIKDLYRLLSIESTKFDQTYKINSKLLEIQSNKLECEQDYWRKQYLPMVDFGLSLSNNKLHLFDRDWNARAGITFRWTAFDFGANSSQAEVFQNRAQQAIVESKVVQNEEKRAREWTLISRLANDKIFEQFSKKVAQNNNKIASLKKLHKNGRISKKGYLSSKQVTLNEQLEILNKQLHCLIKILE